MNANMNQGVQFVGSRLNRVHRPNGDRSSDDIQWLQGLLDNSAGSELDIHFSMPEDTRVLLEWLESKVLPFSHQVQLFEAHNMYMYLSYLGQEKREKRRQLFLDHFSSREWPRLHMLLLFSQGSVINELGLSIPSLRMVSFQNITWRGHEFPLSGLSILILDYAWRKDKTAISFSRSFSSYILPSAHTLTILVINSTKDEIPFSAQATALNLPSLTGLFMELRTPSNVCQLLNRIYSPKLE